jgi:hypothetical protein
MVFCLRVSLDPIFDKIIHSGSTTCIGDSGGGFALEKRSRWYLRGVVSSGNTFKNATAELGKVCNETMPSLYFDLTDQMEWIKLNAFPNSTPTVPPP